ncbi:MAG: diacylglycerol kinase family protein [Clostridia bacterium]|nr:diacylglycerol kinase family protein [Clostridia bacterium]
MQRNIKIYFGITILFVIFNILNKSSKMEWLIFTILCFAVYAAETMNTAIENIVDKLEPKENVYAKNAKDLIEDKYEYVLLKRHIND